MTAAFLGYFGFHAFNGDYGIHAKYRLEERKASLEEELGRTIARREALEARTQLLHDGTLEKDMLDEQVRRTLGMARPDEVVILLDY